jgi:uncharacterized protein DUF1707
MALTEPGRGLLRASHADRERAVDVLKAAFAEGRLSQDEYTDRVGQAHASRTYADLGALVADLPVGPLGTLPLGTLPPAPPPAAVPPASPPPPVQAAASKPRKPMSALEIAALGIVILIVPALAIPVVIGGACIAMARAGSPSPPRARLAAMAVLIAAIAGLALLLHV